MGEDRCGSSARSEPPKRPSAKAEPTLRRLPWLIVGRRAGRPSPTSSLGPVVRGELDWIVMKALEKDRARRYESADGLAADVLRHLASEPVLAAPPSRSYRLRKFARKNRVGVVAASLVLLALVAGVAGTTLGLFEARRQAARANARAEGERLARREAVAAAEGELLAGRKARAAAEEEKKAKETAEAVLGFVESRIFAAARPKGQDGGLGYDVKLADAVTAALPAIENGFPGQPLTEARLRRTIGRSFLDLGKPEVAARQYEAALSLYRENLGQDHPETLRSMNDLASSYFSLGRYAETLKLDEETLALTRGRLGPDHPETLRSMNGVALSYHQVGRHAEALKLGEETLALTRARLGPDHPETFKSMNNLAITYEDLGRHAEALKLREEALELTRARLGPDHPYMLTYKYNLARSYFKLGRHPEALKLDEETLALKKARLGPEHPDTLDSMFEVAIGYKAVGRHAEAVKLLEETLALSKAKLGPDHPATLSTMSNLANSYLTVGRLREAQSLLEKVPSQKGGVANFMLWGSLQAWLGLDEEYGATRQRVLALAKGTNDAAVARLAAQAAVLRPSTDPAELEAVLALGREAVGRNKGEWELLALGMAEFRNGHFAAANEAILAATKAGQDGIAAGIADFYRAMSLFQQGKKDEARDVATKAAAKMKPLPKDEQDPLAGGAVPDNLILWLAYEEAKALIGFDPPSSPAAPAAK